MITFKELSKMNTADIEREIKSRENLLNQMVGTLYPPIVEEEIQQLYERRAEIFSCSCWDDDDVV